MVKIDYDSLSEEQRYAVDTYVTKYKDYPNQLKDKTISGYIMTSEGYPLQTLPAEGVRRIIRFQILKDR